MNKKLANISLSSAMVAGMLWMIAHSLGLESVWTVLLSIAGAALTAFIMYDPVEVLTGSFQSVEAFNYQCAPCC